MVQAGKCLGVSLFKFVQKPFFVVWWPLVQVVQKYTYR
jgi:hypothetical protein